MTKPTPHATPRPTVRLSVRASRILAVATYAGLAIGALGAAVMPGPGFSLVTLAGLVAAVVLFLSTFGFQANAPDMLLDERERGERDRSYVLAHQIIVGTLFVAFIYTVSARSLGWWLPDADAAIDLLSVLGIGALASPGAVLAWLVPAATGDD